jgi:hypothetical protein
MMMSFFFLQWISKRPWCGCNSTYVDHDKVFTMTNGIFRFISLEVTRIRLQFGENQQVLALSFSIWLHMEETHSLLSSRPSFQALSSWVHNTGLMTAYQRQVSDLLTGTLMLIVRVLANLCCVCTAHRVRIWLSIT